MNNVIQLQVEKQIVPKRAKLLAPIKKQAELIKKGKYTKSDINALTKLVNSTRFSDQVKKDQVEIFLESFFTSKDSEYVNGCNMEVLHFNKPQSITKEQTELGKHWLKNYFYTSKGELRKTKGVEQITTNHSDRVLSIAKNVSKFKFVGIGLVRNNYGLVQVLPIYRTYNKAGEYFDYAPVHWGAPVIMEGY